MTYWRKEWVKFFGLFVAAVVIITVYFSAQVYIFKNRAEEFIGYFPDSIWEMEDGIYEGTYKGLSHLARVRFEVENYELIGFNLESIARTLKFHVTPEDFESEIRTQKKLNFDTISGATISSNFIKAAILEAAAAEPAVGETDTLPVRFQQDSAIELSNNGDGTGIRAEIYIEDLSESDQLQFNPEWGAFKYITVTGVYENEYTDELYSGNGNDREFGAIITEIINNPENLTSIILSVNGNSEQFIKAPCKAKLSVGTVVLKDPKEQSGILHGILYVLGTFGWWLYPVYIFLLNRLAFRLFRFIGNRNRKIPDLAMKMKNMTVIGFIVVLMVGGIFGMGALGGNETLSIIGYISTFLGIIHLIPTGIRDVHKNRCPNCHHYGANTTNVKHTGTTVTTTDYVSRKTGATVRTEKSRSSHYAHEMTCPECGCVWSHGESV